MATDYKGAKMHPATRAALAGRWFAGPNDALGRMLGLAEGGDALGWGAAAGGSGSGSGRGGGRA